MRKEFVNAFVIPTGIKASIGGYLGDATPFANLLASISDATLCNPNIVNGGLINLMHNNILYTEGTVMDLFFRGEIALEPTNGNKVGVVIEKTNDRGALALVKNTINAIRAVAGVEVIGIEMTEHRMKAQAHIERGVAHGDVEHLATLDEPIKRLMEKGATTIALSAEITADPEAWVSYYKNKGPNPVGALEAVISHYVVDKYRIPAAHAPIVHEKDWYLNLKDYEVFWRAGAEAITPAYLGCILYGLATAPRIIPIRKRSELSRYSRVYSIDDLSALIVPHTACGGIPVFVAMKRKIPIISVKEIKTNLNVTPESIGIETIAVQSMHEALGVLVSLREGVQIESGLGEARKYSL